MKDPTKTTRDRRSFLAAFLAGAGACATSMLPSRSEARSDSSEPGTSEREARYYEPLYRRGRDQAG